MNKYIVYFTNGGVAHVTAQTFDWGETNEDMGLWFYDDEEYVVAWFPNNCVMGVNRIEKKVDTTAV